MKNVTWPDNTCYVDKHHTCLHGYFTKEELEEIRIKFKGEVSFTPTIHPESAKEQLLKGYEVGHYISCKTNNPAFEPLMVQLRLSMGRMLIRGEGCWPYIDRTEH